MRVPTLAHIQKRYDALRKRYFLDGLGRVPPVAAELQWTWLPVNSPCMAETHFDEDGDPFGISIDPTGVTIPRVLVGTLLHELTHMRVFPRVSKACGTNPCNTWREEALRLVRLGAPLL